MYKKIQSHRAKILRNIKRMWNINHAEVVFYFDEENRTTVCRITVATDCGDKTYKGKAYCDPEDTLDSEVGCEISFGKAASKFYRDMRNKSHVDVERIVKAVMKEERYGMLVDEVESIYLRYMP